MCSIVDLNALRAQSYSHAMGQVLAAVGEPSIWAVNLQHVAAVRSLAFKGRLDRLECLLASAKLHAGRLGLSAAAAALAVKERELKALAAELRERHQLPSVDVTVLDPDWGKKGRGAKIVAWIQTNSVTVAMVMERFQLARSTSQKYLRRARKAERLALAA